mmetsp:Transcript_28560/g.67882  ORF Transcript_28560/g.67882 Transcript_28560/m.67882 type:complete len:115 (+) Transcript_28560:36-380(+)
MALAALATDPAASRVLSRASADHRLVEKKAETSPSPAPCSHSRLPEAHQLYSYGQREVGYAQELAVPQYNRGVAIVHDFVGPPPQLGRQIVHSDEVWPLMPPTLSSRARSGVKQ